MPGAHGGGGLGRALAGGGSFICKATVITREDLAREEMRRQRVREGLITVIGAVEPCRTPGLSGATRKPSVWNSKLNWGKCAHLYFYYLHPQLGVSASAAAGLVSLHLVQVCFNGREWLAHQMDEAGIKYRRKRDNCFEWIKETWRGRSG